LLNKLFGRPIVSTVDLLWTDRIETRRIRAAIYDHKELVLLFTAVGKELKKKGAKRIRAVPAKIAIPLLENATMENEPRLRLLWAKLLASGMAGEKIERSYVSALGELTGRDAKALDQMYIEWKKETNKKETKAGPITYEGGIDSIGGATTNKLFALGIVTPTFLTLSLYEPPRQARWGDYGDSSEDVSVPGDLSVVKFTHFGEGFCDALGMGGSRRTTMRGY
jgi:hypothetical protein